MTLQIVVADDDDIVVLIHTTLIKKSALGSPLTFSNGKDLREYILLNQNSDKQFLVFLDIHMQDMNAWQFLDSIKDSKEKIFIVLVTSSINKVDKEKARAYKNVVDFIEKPLKIQDCDRIKSMPGISNYF